MSQSRNKEERELLEALGTEVTELNETEKEFLEFMDALVNDHTPVQEHEEQVIDSLLTHIPRLIGTEQHEGCRSALSGILGSLEVALIEKNDNTELRIFRAAKKVLLTADPNVMQWALGQDKNQADVALRSIPQKDRLQVSKKISELMKNNPDIRAVVLQVVAFQEILTTVENKPPEGTPGAQLKAIQEKMAAVDETLRVQSGGYPVSSWNNFYKMCEAIFNTVFSFKHSVLKEMNTAKSQYGTRQFWSVEAKAAAKASQYRAELNPHLSGAHQSTDVKFSPHRQRRGKA